MKDNINYADKRRYVRLGTIFPVEFQLVDKERNPVSYIFQGFTRNVGKGGMCVEAKAERGRQVFEFIPGVTKIKAIINIPANTFAVKAYATVRWVKKISEPVLDTYLFGIEYDEIESDSQKRIERYVFWMDMRPKLALVFFILSLILTVLLTYWATRPR